MHFKITPALSQTASVYLGFSFTVIYSVTAVAIAARTLDPDELGFYAILATVVSLAAVLDSNLAYGPRLIAVRYKNGYAVDNQVSLGWHIRLTKRISLYTLAFSASGVLLSLSLGLSADRSLAAGLVGVNASLLFRTSPGPGIVQGEQRFSALAACSGVANVTRTLFTLLMFLDSSLVLLMCAALFGTVIERGALHLLSRRTSAALHVATLNAQHSESADSESRRNVVRLCVLGVSGQLVVSSDIYAISSIVGLSAAGIYRVASLPGQQLGAAASRILIPFGTTTSGLRDDHAAADFCRRFQRPYSTLVGALTAAAALAAPDLVGLLLGRPSDLGVQVLLGFLLLGLVRSSVQTWATWLSMSERTKAMSRLVPVEVAVNALGTVFAVVIFGPLGAIFTTLLTACLINFVLLPRSLGRWHGLTLRGAIFRDGLAPGILAILIVLIPAALLYALFGRIAAATSVGIVVLVILATQGLRMLRLLTEVARDSTS